MITKTRTIEEASKWYKEKHSFTELFPTLYTCVMLQDGTLGFKDQGGFVVSKEEWETMKLLLDEFYNNKTEEEIDFINEQLKRINCEPFKKAVKESKDKSGYVYLIKADNGLYKIGCSKNVDNRILQLGVKLPYKLTLVKKVFVDDMRKVERQYHKLHETKRVRGEWFDLSLQDVESFN